MSKMNDAATNLISKAISTQDNFDASIHSIVQEIKKENMTFIAAMLSIVSSTLKTPKEIKSSKEPPIRFFLALQMLKECMDTNSIQLANALNTDRSIMKKLGELAKFEAKNPDGDRGHSIFGGKDPDLGIVYLKLALECIYHWQKKFKSDDKNPTAFSEVYDNLLKSKVTFPKPDEFIFFIPPPKKKKPVVDNNVQSTKNPPKQSTPSGFGNPDQDKTKLLREKKEIQDKLREIIELLQETVLINDEPSDFMSESLFQIEKELADLDKKYLNIIQEAFQNPDLFTETDNFKLMEEKDFIFSTVEDINLLLKRFTDDSYKRFLLKSKEKIQKTFNMNTKQTPNIEKKKNIEKSSPYNFPEPQDNFNFKEFSKPEANEFGTFGGNEVAPEQGFAFQNFQEPNHHKEDFNAFGSGFVEDKKFGKKVISSENFQKNDEWAKSNNKDFDEFSKKSNKNMKKSMEESSGFNNEMKKSALTKDSKFKKPNEFQDFHGNPEIMPVSDQSRGRNFNFNDQKVIESKRITFENPRENLIKTENIAHPNNNIKSPKNNQSKIRHNSNNSNNINVSNVQKGYMFPESDVFEERFENLSVSTISVRDFPFKNKVLKDPQRKTPGKLIIYDPFLFDFEFIRENPSNLRKFKQACLKNKCPLYEIQNLQVGVVTSSFFDIPSSKNFLKMAIFYGNKTKYAYDYFSVEYTGDYSYSLWLKNENENDYNNDENIGSIPPKSQLKQEMIINYNSTPFTNVMAEIEMKLFDEKLSFPVYLPLLITKFFNLKQCDSKIFKFKWKIKKDYRLRTDIFALNPKILRHPSYLKRYFPDSCELTSLKEFVSQTKDSDYFDYKVGMIFELNKPDIEYLMKFILRPNMTMYVQISSPPHYISICEYILQTIYFIFSK